MSERNRSMYSREMTRHSAAESNQGGGESSEGGEVRVNW